MLNFGARAWGCGLLAGIFLAALVAVVPTTLDWMHNPGEVFRSGEVTRWSIVWDTFASWFLPAVLLFAPFTVLAFAWLAGRRGGDPCCRGDCR